MRELLQNGGEIVRILIKCNRRTTQFDHVMEFSKSKKTPETSIISQLSDTVKDLTQEIQKHASRRRKTL